MKFNVYAHDLKMTYILDLICVQYEIKEIIASIILSINVLYVYMIKIFVLKFESVV